MSDQNLQHNLDQGQIKKLIMLFNQLRSQKGCSWMKEQDHHSLSKYTIEEAFELAEALDTGNSDEIKKELGDLLLQVILHSQIASESNQFNFFDVVQALISKTEFRHPHVFSQSEEMSTKQIIENWEILKQQEKEIQKQSHLSLNTQPAESNVEHHGHLNIPLALPALQRSAKIGEKCERVKFDWENARQVREKLNEEIQELDDAIAQQNLNEIEHEMGDVLFTLAQLSRHLNLDPEQSLRIANNRFLGRYHTMFAVSGLNNEEFKNLEDEEKQNLWQQAKQLEKKS